MNVRFIRAGVQTAAGEVKYNGADVLAHDPVAGAIVVLEDHKGSKRQTMYVGFPYWVTTEPMELEVPDRGLFLPGQ